MLYAEPQYEYSDTGLYLNTLTTPASDRQKAGARKLFLSSFKTLSRAGNHTVGDVVVGVKYVQDWNSDGYANIEFLVSTECPNIQTVNVFTNLGFIYLPITNASSDRLTLVTDFHYFEQNIYSYSPSGSSAGGIPIYNCSPYTIKVSLVIDDGTTVTALIDDTSDDNRQDQLTFNISSGDFIIRNQIDIYEEGVLLDLTDEEKFEILTVSNLVLTYSEAGQYDDGVDKYYIYKLGNVTIYNSAQTGYWSKGQTANHTNSGNYIDYTRAAWIDWDSGLIVKDQNTNTFTIGSHPNPNFYPNALNTAPRGLMLEFPRIDMSIVDEMYLSINIADFDVSDAMNPINQPANDIKAYFLYLMLHTNDIDMRGGLNQVDTTHFMFLSGYYNFSNSFSAIRGELAPNQHYVFDKFFIDNYKIKWDVRDLVVDLLSYGSTDKFSILIEPGSFLCDNPSQTKPDGLIQFLHSYLKIDNSFSCRPRIEYTLR